LQVFESQSLDKTTGSNDLFRARLDQIINV